MTTPLEEALRAHVATHTVLGTRTRILDVGSGPVVVCSSGVASVLWDWAPVVALLRRTHRVIVVDRPGYAPGDEVSAVLPTLEGEAEHLLAALGACGVTEPVTAVGHSFGAALVEAAARWHPERIRSLVLLDGSVPHAEGTHGHDDAARAARRFRQRTLPIALSRPVGAVWVALGPGLSTVLVPGRRGLARAIPGLRAEAGAQSTLAASLRELAGYPACMGELERLRVRRPLSRGLPVVVVAANGRLPRPGLSLWVRHVLRQARGFSHEARLTCRVLRRSGHFVMLDQLHRTAELIARAAAPQS